jgi:threonine dehydratase
VALEMLEDVPGLDALIVPVGGGGLIAGCAIAAQCMKPGIAVYGVQSEACPAMRDALEGRTPAHGPPVQTIAEGIAVKTPGARTLPIIRERVADILLVAESRIEHALALVLEIEKTVIEGAAAAGLAALLARRELFAGRRVGIVMSGGNIDMRLLSSVILRELAREGRIVSLELQIEDRPGMLAQVASAVGEAGGNILEVSHNRLLTGTPAKSARLGMTFEARDGRHARQIQDRLAALGFRPVGGPD